MIRYKNIIRSRNLKFTTKRIIDKKINKFSIGIRNIIIHIVFFLIFLIRNFAYRKFLHNQSINKAEYLALNEQFKISIYFVVIHHKQGSLFSLNKPALTG